MDIKYMLACIFMSMGPAKHLKQQALIFFHIDSIHTENAQILQYYIIESE